MHTSAMRHDVACGGVSGVRVDTWVESGTDVTPFYRLPPGQAHGPRQQQGGCCHQDERGAGWTRSWAAIPSNLEYLRTIIASEGLPLW